MRTSNATASRVLREHGAVACTDVTGFGLAGHLLEMQRASQSAAVVSRSAIPALPGALELAAAGVTSTMAAENQRLLPDLGTDHRAALLFDPQTSGGLVAGIAPRRSETCIAALRAAGLQAAIIGTVEPGEPMIRIEA
jgi:selenide,water dikinase